MKGKLPLWPGGGEPFWSIILSKFLKLFLKSLYLFINHRFHEFASRSQFMILAEIKKEIFFCLFYPGF